jgi:putative intracellular protease/amidase
LAKIVYSFNFATSKFKKMKKTILVIASALTLIGGIVYAQNSNTIKNNSKMENPKERLSYVHPHGAPSKGKILMVASSPSVSQQTGWPIGFWAAELTHPMRVFQEAGYEIELVSTNGGKLEMDGYSNPTDASGYSAHDIISLGYMQKSEFNQMLENTKKLTDVNPNDYVAIFLVGGQGPMYTFKGNKELEKLFVSFYEAGKPSAAVCHSTTLLLEAKKSNGELLVKGKTWTGFADAEEEYADKAVGQKIQPYRIEDEAKKLTGTTFKVARTFFLLCHSGRKLSYRTTTKFRCCGC